MSRRQKILTPQTQLFDDKKFFDRANKEHKKSIIDGSVLFLAPHSPDLLLPWALLVPVRVLAKKINPNTTFYCAKFNYFHMIIYLAYLYTLGIWCQDILYTTFIYFLYISSYIIFYHHIEKYCLHINSFTVM